MANPGQGSLIMMHHSRPGEQSARHAERSISEWNCSPHFQRWSGCQACYSLKRLEMRWGKGESDRLASHLMGKERGQGHTGLEFTPQWGHWPASHPWPSCPLQPQARRWLLLGNPAEGTWPGPGRAPWRCKPSWKAMAHLTPSRFYTLWLK